MPFWQQVNHKIWSLKYAKRYSIKNKDFAWICFAVKLSITDNPFPVKVRNTDFMEEKNDVNFEVFLKYVSVSKTAHCRILGKKVFIRIEN